MKPLFRKTVSLVLLFPVFLTQTARADLSGIAYPNAISIEQKTLDSFELPAELGTVEALRGDSSAPTVITLQTLHGSYETALKIKEIVEYLHLHQGVGLVFAEGAGGALHPEYLRFTEDKEKNAAVLDQLVRKGEMTAADLALSGGWAQGRGVENTESYKRSYGIYKEVLGNVEENLKALDAARMDLDRRASRVIRPDLREVLSRWLKFGSGRLELLATVEFLRSQASQLLDVDFETVFAQFDWPQITRLVLLQQLGKRQSQDLWASEKKTLAEKLEQLGLDPTFIGFLEAARPSPDARKRVEDFLSKAQPKGLKLKDYPQSIYRAAYKILENEIDSKQLYDEIEKLFEKILSLSALSPEEQKLVQEYKRLILTDKLLRLELSPQDWKAWREDGSASESASLQPLKDRISRAEAFYVSMEDREEAFLNKISESLNSDGVKTAVFIAGGFHGKQMMDKFESRGIANVLVTPHVAGNLEHSAYQKIMLRGATLEQTLLTNEPALSRAQGWDVEGQAAAVRQILKDLGVEAPRNEPYFSAVEQVLTARSELRGADESELRAGSSPYAAEDLGWDRVIGRYKIDGKITDTKDAQGNPIGKFASTPSPYVDAVFAAMELPAEGTVSVIDAGHGTGVLLGRLASRALKLNSGIRFTGIEGSSDHFNASLVIQREALKKKLVLPGQVNLLQGNFNERKDLFREASVVVYAEAGSSGLEAFSETLHELRPGARVVTIGEDASAPGKLRELLTAGGAFDVEVRREGTPKITVYTRRSELRTAETPEVSGYQLVEKELDVKTLFPEDQRDKPLKQIVFISDNTGTMVQGYGDPLSGTILSDSLKLLSQDGFFLLVNSGDPLKDLAEKTYTPLLEGLSGAGREHFHLVADGGSRRIGFSADRSVRYFEELESWPKARRFEYGRVLTEAFYAQLKKRQGKLAEALKDVSDADLDALRGRYLAALEKIGPEGWGEKKAGEGKFVFDIFPEEFRPGWGKVFVYDVGPKVSFDAPSLRDFLSEEFTPGIMAEVQKKYPRGTDDLYVVSVPGAVDMARVSKIEGVEKTLHEQIYQRLDPKQPLLMVVIGDGDNDIPTFGLKGSSAFTHAVVPVFLRSLPSYASRLPEGTFIAKDKMAGTAQVLDHLAKYAGQKISDIPPLKLRQWVRSELRTESAEAIGLDGRLAGLDLYEKVFSQAPDTTLRVGRDIAHTGALQAAALIQGIQGKRKAYDAAGQKDRDVFIIFATGNTQWLGLTTLASILDSWGSWDEETRQLLTANGVDLTDKPDMGRVFATHLDTIFPQSRDDYYSYANELHHMFDKLGISREKRRMFYGDVKNDLIEPGADNQMDKAEFEKVQASIDAEGLRLEDFLKGQLAADHPQFAYLDAVNRYTKKMAEFVLAKGPDIALFSAGPSYEGKGHFAFNEAGTPFDQGLVMSLLSYHAAAGNIKDRGGMQYFRTRDGAIKIGGATLGPKEIRSSQPIFITIINGKEKRESVRSLVERKADIQYPMTALQSGAPGSTLIMESASGSTLRFFTNPWDFKEIPAPEWDEALRAKLFVRLSKEVGKPVSALTLDDWLQSEGKENPEIAAIRAKNLIALTMLQRWEVLRDAVAATLSKEPLKPEQVPARLGLRPGDEIVHIGPHLDDLSLAAQFLVSEFSKQGHRLYSYYTAPGYTAVSDDYVLSALGTLQEFSADQLADLQEETRSVFAFKQNEEKYLRQLIKVLAARDLAYDPMNYDTWSLMPADEQKLRAKLLFLRLNFESSLKGQLSSPGKIAALREALQIYIQAKPHWGSSEIVVMQKLKVALRFVEEQTELMSRGVGYDDIFFPFQSSWYALERKGTARQSDIDVIKDVIRTKKPRMVIVNGEGFMDHGAHSITEMTVKVAVKELYEEGALPEGFRMFFYRGVWDRAEITGRADQILVALGEEELKENKSSFVRNYPSQAPALVPDASVQEPMFFSDQVVTNARQTLAEWAALNGKATDDPALQGILAFDMIDFNSRAAVEGFLAEVVAKKTELDRVQIPINRASLSKIIGSAPPYADLSGKAGEQFLALLAAQGFPYEQVLTKEEVEKTKVQIRSELRTDLTEKGANLKPLSQLQWRTEDAEAVLIHFRALMAKYGYSLPRKIVRDGAEMGDGKGGARYKVRPFTFENLKAFNDLNYFGTKQQNPFDLAAELANAISMASLLPEAWSMPKPFYDYFGIQPNATSWFLHPDLNNPEGHVATRIRALAANGQKDFKVLVQGAWNGEEAYGTAIRLRELFPELHFDVDARDFVEPNPSELNWTAEGKLPDFLRSKANLYFDAVVSTEPRPVGGSASFSAYVLKDEWRGLVRNFAQGDIRDAASFTSDNDVIIASRVLGARRYVSKAEDIRKALEAAYGSLRPGGILVLSGEDDVEERMHYDFSGRFITLDASEGIYQKVGRSELREVLQTKQSVKVNAEVSALRIPFLAEPTGQSDTDAAFLAVGMADPEWSGARQQDFQLTLHRTLEAYYRGPDEEDLENQIASAQTVLKNNHQMIALYTHIRDLSKEEAIRQVFDAAQFLIETNKAQAHYVVLTVDKAEEVELLRTKLMDSLKKRYPEDAALRSRIYARMPIVTSSSRLAGSFIPKGALSAWIDWTEGEGSQGPIPEPARAMVVHADQLSNGEVLRFDESNRGYGVSLLQAALLLLRGPEESGLQASRPGFYVQAGKGLFAQLGSIFKALQSISISA